MAVASWDAGPMAPEGSWKWGTRPEKKFLSSCPYTFLAWLYTRSTVSRFSERFRVGQYSLVTFLFAVFLLTVRPMPSHLYKVGEARALWGRRRCAARSGVNMSTPVLLLPEVVSETDANRVSFLTGVYGWGGAVVGHV